MSNICISNFSTTTKKASNSETNITSTPKNEDYNLQLLADVATKLPKIKSV